MVKNVLSVSHQGLRDWVVQRISAIYMAAYSLGFITYLVLHSGITYTGWHDLFAQTGVKIATLMFILALMLHAWVGIWTIFTDYVKPVMLRSILNVFVLLMLTACFFWGLLILWSVQ